MPYVRQLLRYTGLLAVLLTTAGCTYQAAVQRLSPSEQVEFHTYSKVITSTQARTYLAKATPVERTAYLRDLGLVQRFQALDPLDREAILAGYPYRGMSAEALRFLWSPPYYTEGRANYYEHWYYLGTSLPRLRPLRMPTDEEIPLAFAKGAAAVWHVCHAVAGQVEERARHVATQGEARQE